MREEINIKEKYTYDFLDHKYFKSYNVNPLYFCIINEQFECIRKAFNSLDDDSKNVLDYYIIRRLSLDNINVNLDKYLDKLRYRYLYFYEKYYELDNE
ncbi:MAG: hypothetical protein IJ068_07650 [Bacilli bacterium]|nr:hypothetical protein [Bacilli bacterium]